MGNEQRRQSNTINSENQGSQQHLNLNSSNEHEIQQQSILLSNKIANLSIVQKGNTGGVNVGQGGATGQVGLVGGGGTNDSDENQNQGTGNFQIINTLLNNIHTGQFYLKQRSNETELSSIINNNVQNNNNNNVKNVTLLNDQNQETAKQQLQLQIEDTKLNLQQQLKNEEPLMKQQQSSEGSPDMRNSIHNFTDNNQQIKTKNQLNQPFISSYINRLSMISEKTENFSSFRRDTLESLLSRRFTGISQISERKNSQNPKQQSISPFQGNQFFFNNYYQQEVQNEIKDSLDINYGYNNKFNDRRKSSFVDINNKTYCIWDRRGSNEQQEELLFNQRKLSSASTFQNQEIASLEFRKNNFNYAAQLPQIDEVSILENQKSIIKSKPLDKLFNQQQQNVQISRSNSQNQRNSSLSIHQMSNYDSRKLSDFNTKSDFASYSNIDNYLNIDQNKTQLPLYNFPSKEDLQINNPKNFQINLIETLKRHKESMLKINSSTQQLNQQQLQQTTTHNNNNNILSRILNNNSLINTKKNNPIQQINNKSNIFNSEIDLQLAKQNPKLNLIDYFKVKKQKINEIATQKNTLLVQQKNLQQYQQLSPTNSQQSFSEQELFQSQSQQKLNIFSKDQLMKKRSLERRQTINDFPQSQLHLNVPYENNQANDLTMQSAVSFLGDSKEYNNNTNGNIPQKKFNNSILSHNSFQNRTLLSEYSLTNSQLLKFYFSMDQNQTKNINQKFILNQYIFLKAIDTNLFGNMFQALNIQNKQKYFVMTVSKTKLNTNINIQYEIGYLKKISENSNILKIIEVIESSDNYFHFFFQYHKRYFMNSDSYWTSEIGNQLQQQQLMMSSSFTNKFSFEKLKIIPLFKIKRYLICILKALYFLHYQLNTAYGLLQEEFVIISDKNIALLAFPNFIKIIQPQLFNKNFLKYRSPEELQNIFVNFNQIQIVPSKEQDIWALGVLLYKNICSQFPYDATNLQELTSLHNQNQIQLSDDLDHDIKDFINLCLQKNISDRPSVQDLLQHSFITDLGKNQIKNIESFGIHLQQSDINNSIQVQKRANYINVKFLKK